MTELGAITEINPSLFKIVHMQGQFSKSIKVSIKGLKQLTDLKKHKISTTSVGFTGIDLKLSVAFVDTDTYILLANMLYKKL